MPLQWTREQANAFWAQRQCSLVNMYEDLALKKIEHRQDVQRQEAREANEERLFLQTHTFTQQRSNAIQQQQGMQNIVDNLSFWTKYRTFCSKCG